MKRNNLISGEKQPSTKTAEDILNDFSTWSIDLDLKKEVNKILMGCLSSDQEYTAKERQRMIEMVEILNFMFEDLDQYRIDNKLAYTNGLRDEQFN